MFYIIQNNWDNDHQSLDGISIYMRANATTCDNMGFTREPKKYFKYETDVFWISCFF